MMLRVLLPALETFVQQVPCCKLRENVAKSIEVTSTCSKVLRQLATWKCVARQLARAGSVIRVTLCSTCNAILLRYKLREFVARITSP